MSHFFFEPAPACVPAIGRCRVERFLNMSGDGRPPKVDEMKCYMMQPHRVGIARPEYWKYGKGLRDTNVVQLASSRNHMVAIGLVKEDSNKKAEKYRKEKEELEAASSESSLSDGDESSDHGMLGSSKVIMNVEYSSSLIGLKKKG